MRIGANLRDSGIKNASFCLQFAPEFGSKKYGFPSKLAPMRLRGNDKRDLISASLVFDLLNVEYKATSQNDKLLGKDSDGIFAKLQVIKW